jgi:hypothetical protein
MKVTVLTSCFLTLIGLVFAETVRSDEKAKAAKFSMPMDEFRRLSVADQKALLVGVFKHRLEHAKNIKYEALQKINISEYENEKPGKITQWVNGSRLRHSVLKNSFRMETIRGGVDVSIPKMFVVCGFNADTGLVMSTVKHTDRNRSFGRIGTEVDRINDSNHYAYWLDGEHTTQALHIFRYFVEHSDEYAVEVPQGEKAVRLSVPWYCPWSEVPLGTRTMRLDPAKGFFPVYGKGRWEEFTSDGRPSWRMEEFFVEDSQLVGDVWMPTKLREVIAASTGGGKMCNVYHITVSSIEAGSVTPEDLEVSFSMDMEIVDTIKSQSYVVGPNGERTRVKPLFVRPPD